MQNLSTVDDILDFSTLSQEAVKVMQRETRVSLLAKMVRSIRVAESFKNFHWSIESNDNVKDAKFRFLSEI